MRIIPAFHSPSGVAADSQYVALSLGPVTFLGRTSDTVWWVNLKAMLVSNTILFELFFSYSPLKISTPLWPHLQVPIIVKGHSTHIKIQQFLDKVTLRKITAETIGVTWWTSYWNNLAMKTGFTLLLLLVEKKPDTGVYVLDKENMPITPGP